MSTRMYEAGRVRSGASHRSKHRSAIVPIVEPLSPRLPGLAVLRRQPKFGMQCSNSHEMIRLHLATTGRRKAAGAA